MAVTVTYSNYAKYALANKQVDLNSDTIKVLLMRSGFVFDADKHREVKNIHGTITASTLAFVDGGAGEDSITDSGNGFLTAGFAPGNKVTISGSASNNITATVISAAAGTLTFATGTLTTEAAGASVTITADDELATGAGYTQATKTTGTVTLTENTTDNRADASYPTVSWTATGGPIGPTPGAILHDSTANVILQYINFGEELTAVDTANFNIVSGTLRIS